MRYIAAYILAKMGGNECPTTEDLAAIIGSVGAGFEQDKAEMVIAQLAGKNLDEIMEKGKEKLASVQAPVQPLNKISEIKETDPEVTPAENDAQPSDDDYDSHSSNNIGFLFD